MAPRVTTRGNWVDADRRAAPPVDLVAAYNATHDPDLGGDAGWTPTLRASQAVPAPLVPLVVGPFAGAGRLPL